MLLVLHVVTFAAHWFNVSMIYLVTFPFFICNMKEDCKAMQDERALWYA